MSRLGGELVAALALAGALLSAACQRDVPAKPAGREAPTYPRLQTFDSAERAFARVLATGPRVLAIGEYHQTEATAQVTSCVRRFRRDLLEMLAGRASDLVLETWVTSGRCGRQEEQATAEIGRSTERPEKTEDELVALLDESRALDITPHILKVGCKDYQALVSQGELDYHRLLVLTGRKMRQAVRRVLASRAGNGESDQPMVVVYGGAIHNDLAPLARDREFAFGPQIAREVDGCYVELDLVVPAFVDPQVVREQDWYALYPEALASGKPALITRGPHSFVLVWPR